MLHMNNKWRSNLNLRIQKENKLNKKEDNLSKKCHYKTHTPCIIDLLDQRLHRQHEQPRQHAPRHRSQLVGAISTSKPTLEHRELPATSMIHQVGLKIRPKLGKFVDSSTSRGVIILFLIN
jgi:hypothetical protein